MYLEIFQKKNVFLVEDNPLCQLKTSALERRTAAKSAAAADSCVVKDSWKDGPGGGGAGLHPQDTGGGGPWHEGAHQYVPYKAAFP